MQSSSLIYKLKNGDTERGVRTRTFRSSTLCISTCQINALFLPAIANEPAQNRAGFYGFVKKSSTHQLMHAAHCYIGFLSFSSLLKYSSRHLRSIRSTAFVFSIPVSSQNFSRSFQTSRARLIFSTRDSFFGLPRAMIASYARGL